jgi:S-adenosylmethionine hydrolase
MTAIITLLTDFGIHDPFVGIMKGVVLSIAPGTTIVDISHSVPSFSLRMGAHMLRESFPCFPEGTIHLAVVDPGVGTARRALAMSAAGHLFVAPDNGLLSSVWRECRPSSIVEITARRYFREPVSATFHGRDIFAPVAAWLARGEVAIEDLGPPAADITLLPPPYLARERNTIIGEVLFADHFGNIMTSITRESLENKKVKEIQLNAMRLDRLSPHYEGAGHGGFQALINSSGNLEIALYRGDAWKTSGVEPGDRIVIRYE